MGDADCTYDFRLLGRFVEKLRQGDDFAMGSRWLGSIEPGSMPGLHRYLGTPVTTWILNRLYGSQFTDIHCGMRGISRDALERMGLVSQSWEYASEMVLKSVLMNLRTSEVPVTFYKDREGRVSHHKRSGWFSPFQAAWINLRAMFVYRAEFFALKPGLFFLLVGLLLTLPLSFGTISVGIGHLQPVLDAPGRDPGRPRVAELLLRGARPGAVRLQRAVAGPVDQDLPLHADGDRQHRALRDRVGAGRSPRGALCHATTSRSRPRRRCSTTWR